MNRSDLLSMTSRSDCPPQISAILLFPMHIPEGCATVRPRWLDAWVDLPSPSILLVGCGHASVQSKPVAEPPDIVHYSKYLFPRNTHERTV